MSNVFGTLRAAVAGLTNIQAAAILRERIELVKSQLLIAEDEMERLRSENRRLAQRVEELEREKASRAVAEQYTPHRGALFRRDAAGAWDGVVYCPKCRIAVGAFPPGDVGAMFHCDPCDWLAPFHPRDLPTILASLPRT